MKPQTKRLAKPVSPTSASAPTTPSVKNMSVKKIVAFIALAAIVTFTGILTYRHDVQRKEDEQAFQVDKARFAQVEKDMDAVYAAMTANDKPLKEEKTKSCSYGAMKFEKGPLSCKISYSFVYGADDYSQILEKQAAFMPFFKDAGFRAVGQDLRRLDSGYSGDFSNEPGFYVDLNKQGAVSCSTSFSVYKPTELKFEYVKKPRAGDYSIWCSQNMKTPIYSLEEY